MTVVILSILGQSFHLSYTISTQWICTTFHTAIHNSWMIYPIDFGVSVALPLAPQGGLHCHFLSEHLKNGWKNCLKIE